MLVRALNFCMVGVFSSCATLQTDVSLTGVGLSFNLALHDLICNNFGQVVLGVKDMLMMHRAMVDGTVVLV